jgi:predicted DNA-binding antitoxin AbrB/MazE fold protein
MSFAADATYSDGMLRLDRPLPLKDGERVAVEIKPKISRIRQAIGLLKWTGDPEVLRKIAEDDEFGLLESP